MGPLIVLSQKDFDAFQSEAKKWIKLFGLVDWEIQFDFNDEFPDNRATCCYSDPGTRSAALVLTRSWDCKPDRAEIRMCAFHEVVELLFAQMRAAVSVRGVDPNLVDQEVHRIIRILENTVWRPQDTRKRAKVG